MAVLQSFLLREMPGFGAFLALLVGAFSVGAHAALGSGLAAMALCLGAVVVVGAVFEPLSAEGAAIPFVYLGAAWGIGQLVGARSARADQLGRRREDLDALGRMRSHEHAALTDHSADLPSIGDRPGIFAS